MEFLLRHYEEHYRFTGQLTKNVSSCFTTKSSSPSSNNTFWKDKSETCRSLRSSFSNCNVNQASKANHKSHLRLLVLKLFMPNPSSLVPPYTAAEVSRTPPLVSLKTNGLFMLRINRNTVISAMKADANMCTQILVPKGNFTWRFWGWWHRRSEVWFLVLPERPELIHHGQTKAWAKS